MTKTVAAAALAAGIALFASGCARGDGTSAPGRGKQLFVANCSQCHGATGVEGGVGPSLRGEAKRKNLDQTIAWIKDPQPPMPKLYPAPLGPNDVAAVAAYVESL